MDELEVCEICGAETECTFTGDGRTLCEECLEAEGYEQCDICEEYFQDCVIDDDDRLLCPTCKAENPTLLELMDTCRYVRENINFEVMTYDDVFQEEVRGRINDIISRAIKDHDEEAKAELKKISEDYDNGKMSNWGRFFFSVLLQ